DPEELVEEERVAAGPLEETIGRARRRAAAAEDRFEVRRDVGARQVLERDLAELDLLRDAAERRRTGLLRRLGVGGGGGGGGEDDEELGRPRVLRESEAMVPREVSDEVARLRVERVSVVDREDGERAASRAEDELGRRFEEPRALDVPLDRGR